MKHLLNVSPQTKRLAKVSAKAVLLSHVTRANDLTPYRLQCKRPHEPVFHQSLSFQLSLLQSLRGVEDWQMLSCGTSSISQGILLTFAQSCHVHLMSWWHMMTCHVNRIIRFHCYIWGSAIRYSSPFLSGLDDFACTAWDMFACTVEGLRSPCTAVYLKARGNVYQWISSLIFFNDATSSKYISTCKNCFDFFRLLDLKCQDIHFHLMRTRDYFMSQH